MHDMILPRICLLLFVFLNPADLSAGENTERQIDYRDLNGDGFNDLLIDNNSDGIPDSFGLHVTSAERTITRIYNGSVFEFVNQSPNPAMEARYVFRTRQFGLRGLILDQAACLGYEQNTVASNQNGGVCVGGTCIAR